MTTTYERVAKVIGVSITSDIMGEPTDEEPPPFAPETTLEQLGLDSMDAAELICDLEDEFSSSIGTPDPLDVNMTVRQLADHVEKEMTPCAKSTPTSRRAPRRRRK